ncbi:MAG: hypothetical protein K9J27_09695 [Bacteroidales bacterium]|nr:hypothetical protein [Bacteroidales bacterium]MCF8334364.1 hypothetical protein [Bacteroidales bacterium]
MLTPGEIEKLFSRFTNNKILIIGDIMVDAYIWGNVSRISPEAPVPVVNVQKRENRLGGAANVARNIKAMGAQPILCSVIGEDRKGDEFLDLLKEEEMSREGIVRSQQRMTTTKFRILGNKTQMLRVDEEKTSPVSASEKEKFLEQLGRITEKGDIDAVVFQDYDKGAIDKEIIETVITWAKSKGIPVAVDPKKMNFMHYSNATLFKPNLKELKEGTKTEFDISDTKALEEAVDLLQEKLSCDMLMVTLSERGIYLKYRFDGEQKSYREPAHKREIADVSGAGDTVISIAALCLAQDITAGDMATISNLAGGLVCEVAGVVPVDKTKLLQEAKNIYHNPEKK